MKKQPDKGKITALYERLSHDDERAGESVSIENQKRILEDYAQKNGFTNIRHFTDDGVRGTTFKRPGLDAMLEEIRAGNVATVIIKDQSRIGRDVVEVGLLKRTFDEYHVRFIAANDNLDTANGFDIMSIFRDVINEWYVADTSRKIKTVFKSRMEKGLRCSGSVSYGYLASRENKGEWVIDEEAAILAATQRVSWYVRHNEAEFIERVREASDQHQENAVKEYRQKVSKAQRRCKELDGLVKKLYEGNATGKIPDKHFTRLLAEYDEEQTGLEAAIAQWQEAIESWNADRLKTDKFIELVSRYTDFSELTTPMLNEFIEKVVVHEGEGRGNSRRQQEEQAAKEAHSQELAKAREEKRKAEKREFTARKKAGLLTPEEQAADEARLAHNRAWQKEWREKRKAAEPPKPPKPKSLKELAALQKAGADLTPEEAERLAAYREKKNRQHKAWYERQKAAQPPKPRTLKELAAAQDAGQPLTPEETERLEASRSRKKNAYQELKTQAETDPAAAAELARRRAYHSEATKKSRQKMYEEAAAGNPEAQARYENFLAARRENYHKKKQDEKGEQIA